MGIDTVTTFIVPIAQVPVYNEVDECGTLDAMKEIKANVGLLATDNICADPTVK